MQLLFRTQMRRNILSNGTVVASELSVKREAMPTNADDVLITDQQYLIQISTTSPDAAEISLVGQKLRPFCSSTHLCRQV